MEEYIILTNERINMPRVSWRKQNNPQNVQKEIGDDIEQIYDEVPEEYKKQWEKLRKKVAGEKCKDKKIYEKQKKEYEKR